MYCQKPQAAVSSGAAASERAAADPVRAPKPVILKPRPKPARAPRPTPMGIDTRAAGIAPSRPAPAARASRAQVPESPIASAASRRSGGAGAAAGPSVAAVSAGDPVWAAAASSRKADLGVFAVSKPRPLSLPARPPGADAVADSPSRVPETVPEVDDRVPTRPAERGRRASRPKLRPASVVSALVISGAIQRLRGIVAVAAALLLACLVAPHGWYEPPTFSWDVLALPGAMSGKLFCLLIAAGALQTATLALLPVTPGGRAAAALVIGGASIAGLLVLVGASWRESLATAGLVIMAAGLVLRWHQPTSLASRLLVTLGSVWIVATGLIPRGDEMPVVEAWMSVSEGLGADNMGAALRLAVTGLAGVSLVVWWPGSRRVGAIALAWIAMAWPLIAAAMLVLVSPDPAAAVIGRPVDALLQPVCMAAWALLVGYGGAVSAALLARDSA